MSVTQPLPSQASVLHWGGEAIWQQVMQLDEERSDTRLAGFSIEILPSIDSTNSELMRRARAGHSEPTLLVAEQQTAGRGRMGRVWESQPGVSLAFSIGLLLAPKELEGLSLAVGVSVAHHLSPPGSSPRVGYPIQLKWPNDLWCQDRKLGGILIETIALAETAPSLSSKLGAFRYVVVGVGINISERSAQGLSTPPAWLQDVWPQATAPLALACLAVPLVRDLLTFEAQGFTPFVSRYASSDTLYGREVTLSDGRQGTAQGVDHLGALMVRTPDGVQRVTSAEVSVRPRVPGVHN